jgi:hypothetical protein
MKLITYTIYTDFIFNSKNYTQRFFLFFVCLKVIIIFIEKGRLSKRGPTSCPCHGVCP